MLKPLFHAWERRLASVSTDRVVRPFEWGVDWLATTDHVTSGSEPEILSRWVAEVMADTDRFFTPPPTSDYHLAEGAGGVRLLTFPSAFTTPHPENNTVYCRYFPARERRAKALRHTASERHTASMRHTASTRPRAAVLVLPQWNSGPSGHVGLCEVLAWAGLSALRLALPYHDQRMPPDLHRADYIVSSNVGRTVQVCRQAVLDARRAIQWLAREGYERIGILGTSLGSCLALLTTAHEPLIRAEALNHISPYFADVVWRGLSTQHVRKGFDGRMELDLLRTLWKPISPRWYLDRVRDRQTLLVYARYDLTFPVDLSEDLVREFRELHVPHEVVVLPCGHYTSGKAPFKFVDAWVLTRFLRRALLKSDGR